MADTVVVEPDQDVAVEEEATTKKDEKPRRQPRYHVILWNDDDHTYLYVIRMMKELFNHPAEKGYKIAHDVHFHGKAIVLTTTREHAELKRDQIKAFGRDSGLPRCKGSMSSSIEPEA